MKRGSSSCGRDRSPTLDPALCPEASPTTRTGPDSRRSHRSWRASLAIHLSDAVRVLAHVFRGGAAGYCADAMDSDDDGAVTISDPVRILNALFQAGSPLEERGYDRTPDALSCTSYEG